MSSNLFNRIIGYSQVLAKKFPLDPFSQFFNFLEGEYSEEYQKFLTSGYKCSQCHNVLIKLGVITARYYTEDMVSIPGLKPTIPGVTSIQRQIMECPHCNHKWTIITKSNQFKFVRNEEIGTFEKLVYSEPREYDNTGHNKKILPKVTSNRKWSRSCSIQVEKTEFNGQELNLGLTLPKAEVLNLKLTAQESLKKQYTITESEEMVITNEIPVEVDPLGKLTVLINWKHIVKKGFAIFCDINNKEFKIPFEVVVGMNYTVSFKKFD